MHHRLLTAFHARPARFEQPAADAGPGEEKDESRADSKNETAVPEKEIERPPQPRAEPPTLRRSPRTNKGNRMKEIFDGIHSTVAALRRFKEKIDYWGRSSRPENQAALSLLLDRWGGGV